MQLIVVPVTTLIIHGTMTTLSAKSYSWWQTSWQDKGALCGLMRGMNANGAADDIWKVDNRDVSEIPVLRHDRRKMFVTNGRFYWSGFNQKQFRLDAGDQLARYLNLIVEYAAGEELRIIAHSHGCNVVKACTSSAVLDPSIVISKVCFLACPHFESPGSKARFPYRLNPDRVGEIINLFTDDDSVQDGVADLIPNMFGDGFGGWVRDASRVETDPQVEYLYQNHHIETVDRGTKAHTAMHGFNVFYMLGQWLTQDVHFSTVLAAHQHLLPIPKGDFGA